jgi:PAS domain S-box-containing protein
MFLNLWDTLLAHVADEPEQRRAARLLYIIVAITLLFNGMNSLSVYFSLAGKANLTINLVTLALQIILLGLVYTGRVRLAGQIFCAFAWLVITYAVYDVGGLLNPTFSLFAISIMAAGLLNGPRAALLFTALSVGNAVGFLLAAQQGRYPSTVSQITTTIACVNYSTVFLFLGTMFAFFASDTRAMLGRVRRNEQDLAEKNRSLEAENQERQQIEEALRQSEQRYRELFENNPYPMWVYDRATLAILAVNDAAVYFYGYSRPEFLTLTIKDLRPEAEVPELLRVVQEERPNFAAPRQWRHRKKDGTLFDVEVSGHNMLFEGRPARLALAINITERKKAEAALRSSEEWFRALIEKSSDIVAVLKPDATVSFISPSVQSVMGYMPGEVQGHPYLDFVHPGDLARVNEVFENILRSPGQTHVMELRVLNKAGVYHVLEATTRSLLHVPSVNGVVVNFRDVTERRQVEDALRQSEERFRVVLANSPLTVYSQDSNLRYTWIYNPVGMTIGEMIGKRDEDIYAPEEAAVLMHLKRLVLETGRGIREEISITANTLKRRFDLTIEPLYSDRGVVGITCVALDMTERYHILAAQLEAEIRYEQIIQSTAEAVITVDETQQIVMFNRSAEQIFGYSASEIIGQRLDILLPPDVAPRHREYVEQFRDEPASARGMGLRHADLHGRRKDGSLFPMDASISKVDHAGRPLFTVMLQDITHRKRAEQMIREAERLVMEVERDKQVMGFKERFVSFVSHEFRTPLSIILSSKELLHHYGERMTPEQREEHFRNITEQTQYMITLLEEILMLDRAQSGTMPFNPSAVDIVDFCHTLVEQMSLMDKGVHRLQLEADVSFGELLLDEGLLRHILGNLMTNALKYSPPGGAVELRVYQEAGDLVLQVRDYGIGIPPDDMRRLFEPFFRASNVRQVSGTGLGLVIVKNSIEAHGGSIAVESQVGEGTTFIVRLPALAVAREA